MDSRKLFTAPQEAGAETMIEKMNESLNRAMHRFTAAALLYVVAATLLILFGGCRATKYVPVERVRTEYVEADTSAIFNRLLSHFEAQREKERRADSLVDRLKETVVINEQGDTTKHYLLQYVYLSADHSQLLASENADRDNTLSGQRITTASVRVDSVPVPYPVEKELTAWQRVKMDYGGVAIAALAAAVIFGISIAVKWLLKRFRK